MFQVTAKLVVVTQEQRDEIEIYDEPEAQFLVAAFDAAPDAVEAKARVEQIVSQTVWSPSEIADAVLAIFGDLS